MTRRHTDTLIAAFAAGALAAATVQAVARARPGAPRPSLR